MARQRPSARRERPPARPCPYPDLLWVDAADYAEGADRDGAAGGAGHEAAPGRGVDPAPLARLLDAWSYAAGTGGGAGGRGRIGPAALDELSREVADDARDGPVHLARLVAAMETSAQATGGSLARVSDTPAVTRVCGGALHHLIEVLHGDGLRSATTVARGLDGRTRLLVLSALRPYWQAPVRALSTPMRDGQLRAPRQLWHG
ncbi:hypothetical protein K378_04280 [Streptomyces sp. Amel2xB2]|uniref:hypothetical protein n=1 Tax=Streptomyces sp. Amel2xB2 TaxID=1305829 RepID=UPI000DC0293F|nr:hypothetical protein [Streptomyces sp. Amel2xB2]RAJ60468.1 hypothetical protein K378_04280 [Streptomyces sp. Amel2xB2]